MTFETLAQQGLQRDTLAAAVARKIYAARNTNLIDSMKPFDQEEHRLEYVATIRGIEFINDSKATTVNATWYAFEKMSRKFVWIVGGQGEQNDYSSLKPLIAKQVKAIVCLGIDNSKIIEEFSGMVPLIVQTQSAKDATDMAYHLSETGDAVLFSPACKSFDLFESYEDRGKQFKMAVNEL